jgi:hypothetical protein
MADSLEIFPIKVPGTKRPANLPHMLLPAPNVMLFCGAVRSGKTVTALNLMLRNRFYGRVWSRIIIFSPSAHQDDVMRACLAHPLVEHHAHMSDEIIRQLIVEQDAAITEAREMGVEPPQMLIYCDDCLGERSLLPSSELSKLLSKHRHFKVSVWVAIQQFRAVPPVLRNNMGAMFIFRLSDAERKKINDEHGGAFGPEFLEMLDWACRKRYSFMYCRLAGDGPAAWERLAGAKLYDDSDRYDPQFTRESRFAMVRRFGGAGPPADGRPPRDR